MDRNEMRFRAALELLVRPGVATINRAVEIANTLVDELERTAAGYVDPETITQQLGEMVDSAVKTRDEQIIKALGEARIPLTEFERFPGFKGGILAKIDPEICRKLIKGVPRV
ncbi:MAG: hypothetical protein P4L36_16875 [Holophaga sp.]|nr:hypothetical protein [Holophaga sp.]